jgi:Mg/Co/Ni transporter MgtE
MSFALSAVLAIFGFLRVHWLSAVPAREALAITLALASIVLVSVITGSALPLIFFSMNIDPANSSTTIQVIMDIAGVLITCFIAYLMLDYMV